MDKKTEKYIDSVTELMEAVGMEEAVKLLNKHDKTRKYYYGESQPPQRIYFSDDSLGDNFNARRP